MLDFLWLLACTNYLGQYCLFSVEVARAQRLQDEIYYSVSLDRK